MHEVWSQELQCYRTRNASQVRLKYTCFYLCAVQIVSICLITRKNYELFLQIQNKSSFTFFDKSFQYIVTFFIIEWFASQTKFKTVIQEMEKEELNECLTMSYAAVRREEGTEFKVSTLKSGCL